MKDEIEQRMRGYLERVTRTLDTALPAADAPPQRLHEAMRYAVMNGGKRIRPMLVYATGECLGVDFDRLDAPAAAIELVHAFSLVHDDLPAMDDDELRRGIPTLHVRYDEATAILAADALQPLAFAVIAHMPSVSGDARSRIVALLADACGSIGMTGGQSLDLAAEGQRLATDELEHMYALKTGALIHASVMAPSLLVDGLDEERRQALDRFARNVGVAFQIRDDLLDIESETEVIGKPARSDLGLRKATYPALFGIEASYSRCNELVDDAFAALAAFGDRAAPLLRLAEYIVHRNS